MGFYRKNVEIGGKEYCLDSLTESYNEGSSGGEILWYSVPRFSATLDQAEIKGTIRSANCKMILSNNDQSMCSNCESLTRNQPFIKRIQRASENMKQEETKKQLSSKNNKYLNTASKDEKLSKYRKMFNLQRLKIYDISKQVARLRA